MTIRKEIDMKKPLTDEQKQMLEALKTRPITPDEDCPELTDEQLNKLAELAQQRREERNKQTVTLRLSPQALRTARSLGKGYTSVLSRIIEGPLADEESVYQLSFAILRRIAVTSSRSVLPLPFTSAFFLP